MRSLHILALLLVLPGAAIADTPSAALLEGYWYGVSYQPVFREKTQELMHRRADGTFEIEFRLYKNCTLELEQKETGNWSIRRGLYHTDTLTVNGAPVDEKNPSYHDDYTIEKLDGRAFTYTHVVSHVRATDMKVDRDFIFPACGA